LNALLLAEARRTRSQVERAAIAAGEELAEQMFRGISAIDYRKRCKPSGSVNRRTNSSIKAPAGLLPVAFLLAWPVLAQEAQNELWPELNVFVKLSENSRLYLLASGTRVEEQGNSDGQLGVHLDFFTTPILKNRMERTARRIDVAKNKFLQIRIGYLFSRSSKSSSNPFVEHTPMFETSPRYYLPKQILLTERAKVDLRFVDGVFTPRFRDRLRVERTLRVSRTAITPYAHVEAFYDWRYDTWHRFRYAGGVEWELSRRLVLEGYYLRQRDNRSSTKYLNAVGLVLQLYLR